MNDGIAGEAVKAYIAATKFRKYERMDEVLFRLAFLLTSVKKEDQARAQLEMICKDLLSNPVIEDYVLTLQPPDGK